MNELILVFVLICPKEPDYYSNRLYYGEQSCKEAGFGTALNLYLAHGKKCEYKCVKPQWFPKEAE